MKGHQSLACFDCQCLGMCYIVNCYAYKVCNDISVVSALQPCCGTTIDGELCCFKIK